MSCMFHKVYDETTPEDGVRKISYEQFMQIRTSGEKYKLLDVLSTDSYHKGHIEGANSFPVTTIDEKSASHKLSKDDNIIVYCGGFSCEASTKAAKTLTDLGYSVLDYKGGLEEWQQKGNELVSK